MGSPDERAKLTITGVGGVKPAKVRFILEDAGYWRKANPVHRWFVENVQHGEDDCRKYYVSRAQPEALLGAVNRVLASGELVDGKVHTHNEYNTW
jgi:hypothetical protein